jgi:outer membrane biosynthesis protein TonB
MARVACLAVSLLAFAVASADATSITVTGPNSAYLKRVDSILIPSLLAELAKHSVSATISFSFIVDERGHLRSIEVQSSPKDRAAEKMISRTIRRLKFPPVPPGRPNGNKVIQIRNTLRPKP